jgi:hypothetical protein
VCRGAGYISQIFGRRVVRILLVALHVDTNVPSVAGVLVEEDVVGLRRRGALVSVRRLRKALLACERPMVH